MSSSISLAPDQCRRARLARDARFDGRFFVAVVTTGIYCRPICPAKAPLERNVRYFDTAFAAAEAGFRPCLRCRPDSAPGSPAWRGTDTTLRRALRLIDEGALTDGNMTQLAERLGIGERHLRGLFQRRFGVSPKAYALHRQCLFAKQLLHETQLPITEIAFASGFSSVRRFNDTFHSRIGLSPREVRRQQKTHDTLGIELKLSYRPPYAWETLRDFYAQRSIEGLEWVGDNYLGRHFQWGSASGKFTAYFDEPGPNHASSQRHGHHAMRVELTLDDLRQLAPVVANIRRVLDLDADPEVIAAVIEPTIERSATDGLPKPSLVSGLRLPGIWSPFEARIRAILGQQVSIIAARRLTQTLVNALGEPASDGGRHFPTPSAIAQDDLAFLGMPQRRRQTLKDLATAAMNEQDNESISGIGPWTRDYARLRGDSDPDVWLPGDAGVKRALKQLPSVDPESATPWRSYLLLQLWNLDHEHQAR